MNCPKCGFAFVISNVCYRCPTQNSVASTPNRLPKEYKDFMDMNTAWLNSFHKDCGAIILRLLNKIVVLDAYLVLRNDAYKESVLRVSGYSALQIDHSILKINGLPLFRKSSKKLYFSSSFVPSCSYHNHLEDWNGKRYCIRGYNGTTVMTAKEYLDSL